MEHWAQKCDGAGCPAEYIAVCKERDELKAALDGAKLSMQALNEKLVEVTAERDGLVQIVKELDCCRVCAHEPEVPPCDDAVGFHYCETCGLRKIVCCRCKEGSRFVFGGVKKGGE